MSQATGFPGGGLRLAKGIVVLCGYGNPNNSMTPDVVAAQLGSLFLQQDGTGAPWYCSSSGSPGLSATWVQL